MLGAAHRALRGHPGNLRQYASVLRTALALLDPGEPRIDWQHLPDDLLADLQQGRAAPSAPAAPATQPAQQKLAAISRTAMLQALHDTQGNWSAAARQLGISRQTLYRKMASP